MRLILVRHAEAAPGDPDDLRPLTDTGRATARELGERLAELEPRTVICSPLLRARETAEAIARASGVPVEVEELLAPGADADGLREAAAGREGPLVAVGHQPDCSEIVLALTGGTRDFAPGEAAELEL
jgi:phosphohistidine phosphatase